MSAQEQFLNVIDRDEAEARFRAALQPRPVGTEIVSLSAALERVLAANVLAPLDVPSFDRSNFDGFALRASDTWGASELVPVSVRLRSESLEAGIAPDFELEEGTAVEISTGGMIPRGADAVLMTEHADIQNGQLQVSRPVTPGFGISFAGTDIAMGETVLREGMLLTSRETGVLAAMGLEDVLVFRRPRVTIMSTGNEIIAPGQPMRPALVFDSNRRILSDAVRELGGVPIDAGIISDDLETLRQKLHAALAESDVVLLSGGTSKGRGDLCYRAVAELTDPGIVAHGVALKPGKPLCLAVCGQKAVVVLPGFPTSAIFTFHEFVAPVLRIMGGLAAEREEFVTASLAVKTNSEVGRTEYLLVGLVETEAGLSAFPMGKGSGSVTTFSRADGFVTIGRHTEIVEAGELVRVRLIGRGREVTDLIVIGSHCAGLDLLLTMLQRQGFSTKLLTVGSSAGLAAAKRGECDAAGVHLLDPNTGIYNQPFLSEGLDLIPGYQRQQGIVFRMDDGRFTDKSVEEIAAVVTADKSCVMVNRNQGSGTRILIDRLLSGARPAGYAIQPANHNAVAAAIVQRRADWGVTIQSIAQSNGLAFVPLQDEHFDFAVPRQRRARPAVKALIALLQTESVRAELQLLGCR